MNTRIKICGITTPRDARLAVDLGADYVGVIFTESPRRVDLEGALAIRRAVPEALLVGVFRDAPVSEVVETVLEARLDLVQLHGRESPTYADTVLRRTGRPIIKAFPSDRLPDPRALGAYETTSFFLVDLDKRKGGRALERRIERVWDAASERRRQGFRIFLAGALRPDNVRRAIARTNAYCVDVCSGVELSPGRKDPAALKRFIAEARG